MAIELMKLSLQQIAEATGESLTSINNASKAGHLDTFIVGRRRFAKPEAVKAWIDYLEKQSKEGNPVLYQPRSSERKETT